MEDNESQPTNVLDMIATDASPAEITDTLKICFMQNLVKDLSI